MHKYLKYFLVLAVLSSCSDSIDNTADAFDNTPLITLVTSTSGAGDNGYNDGIIAGVMGFYEKNDVRLSLVNPQNLTEARKFLQSWLVNEKEEQQLLILASSEYEQLLKDNTFEPSDKKEILLFESNSIPNVSTFRIQRYGASYLAGCIASPHRAATVVAALPNEPILTDAINGFTAGYETYSDNKVEILFKHQMFAPAHRIDNIEAYLEKYTHKQITVACTNNALNTLPLMTQFGNLEPELLQKLEAVMRKRKDGRCVRTVLEELISHLGLDTSDLDRRLVNFLKKQEHFQSALYEDYINLLSDEPELSLADFFDKDYRARHWAMVQQRMLQKKLESRPHIELAYANIAKELSWIDREENGYHIIVPKTIADFYEEGTAQHNCVFTREYYLAMIRRYSIIVFLRKEKEKSFITIEYDYDTFEVCQALGKYNDSIAPELYEYIVNLGKRLNYEMRSHQ